MNTTGFYQELYAASQGDAGACPWLAQGLFVAADGRMASCCFQKDAGGNNFGRIGEVAAADVLHKRRAIAENLRNGCPPPGCYGCAVARKIMVAQGNCRLTVDCNGPLRSLDGTCASDSRKQACDSRDDRFLSS